MSKQEDEFKKQVEILQSTFDKAKEHDPEFRPGAIILLSAEEAKPEEADDSGFLKGASSNLSFGKPRWCAKGNHPYYGTYPCPVHHS